jgi:hypothetical protein
VVDAYAIEADGTLQVFLVADPAASIGHCGSIAICCAELGEDGMEWLLNREHGLPDHS